MTQAPISLEPSPDPSGYDGGVSAPISEQIFTTRQVSGRLGLSSAMTRRYGEALEQLPGEPIRQHPRDGRQYRAVPLPADFLYELDLIHHLRGKDRIPTKQLLWNWHRSTAWRKVKGVMEAANIEGTHASPKGLRHGFEVAHALNKTPLPLLQRWMGHSKQEATAIYMQAVGQEERELAGAVW